METQRATPNIELPPMGTSTPEQNASKSLTHWVWTPYRDINNMGGPPGIRSLLGYRGQAWTLLKRCVPYPLGNMVQEDVDRAAVAEAHASGFSMNMQVAPKIEYIKYAQDQANELGESYADEQGLRILVPLLGMDDRELVNNIVQVVQPFEYRIFEMASEFTEGATRRIKDSNLSASERQKAVNVAAIMAHGAEKALIKATTEYRMLITLMSNAQIGKEPGISEPNDFHVWICEQLNKPVPKRVNAMESQQSQSVDSGTIKVLLERDAEREREMIALRAQVAENAQRRGPGRPPMNREVEA